MVYSEVGMAIYYLQYRESGLMTTVSILDMHPYIRFCFTLALRWNAANHYWSIVAVVVVSYIM